MSPAVNRTVTPTVLTRQLTAAVEAATAGDAERFDDILASLAAKDPVRVGTVQAALIRAQLELSHPSGLDADDVRELVTACVTGADWFTALQPDALLVVLAGALGVLDPEAETPALSLELLIAHGCLIIAELQRSGTATVSRLLSAVFAEIERAETIELP